MDSVRFGRALGFGARSAARALVSAVDAAAAPNPAAAPDLKTAAPAPQPFSATRPKAAPATRTPAPSPKLAATAHTAARAAEQARHTRRGLARGGRRFGTALWDPLAKLSRVLWLEMTGAFFGLFALFAAQAAWNHRADLHMSASNHDAHRNALVFCAMALLFGYFCISSFIRAHRRGRQA